MATYKGPYIEPVDPIPLPKKEKKFDQIVETKRKRPSRRASGNLLFNVLGGIFAGISICAAIPGLAGIFGFAPLVGESVLWSALISLPTLAAAGGLLYHGGGIRPVAFAVSTVLTAGTVIGVYNNAVGKLYKDHMPPKHKLELAFNNSASKINPQTTANPYNIKLDGNTPTLG